MKLNKSLEKVYSEIFSLLRIIILILKIYFQTIINQVIYLMVKIIIIKNQFLAKKKKRKKIYMQIIKVKVYLVVMIILYYSEIKWLQ